MDSNPWPSEFEATLRKHLPLAEGVAIEPGQSLADLGLDSLGTVSLLVDLEDEFEVAFPDELLNLETFATGWSLWTAITNLTPATGQ